MRKFFAEVALNIYLKLEGDTIMMAMLFAERVILGKTDFTATGVKGDVPMTLKPQVAEILLDSGLPELVPIEYGGTKA